MARNGVSNSYINPHIYYYPVAYGYAKVGYCGEALGQVLHPEDVARNGLNTWGKG